MAKTPKNTTAAIHARPNSASVNDNYGASEGYEMLCVGDLVQYVDPIPEDLRIIDGIGVVVYVEGANYMRVVWQTGVQAGVYLRRELSLVARAQK